MIKQYVSLLLGTLLSVAPVSITFANDDNISSWADAVTIAGFPGDTVILKPNVSGEAVLLFGSSNDQYIIIDNLILDATNTGNSVAAVGFFNGHHIRIQNSEIMKNH